MVMRSLVVAVLLAAVAVLPGVAQAPQPGMPEMMKKHQQMMAEMQASSAKLDALVKTMNSATGAAKTDAVAAVVNELARQHIAMTTRMGTMHEEMMGAMGGGMRGMKR
jgi:hypothetical protein